MCVVFLSHFRDFITFTFYDLFAEIAYFPFSFCKGKKKKKQGAAKVKKRMERGWKENGILGAELIVIIVAATATATALLLCLMPPFHFFFICLVFQFPSR